MGNDIRREREDVLLNEIKNVNIIKKNLIR